jgi:hypothetical protein
MTPLQLSKTVEFDCFTAYQEGIPLDAQIRHAREKGTVVNLAVFACDAYAAGWDDFKLRTVLQEAARITGTNFSWPQFDKRMGSLYDLAGAPVHARGGGDSDVYKAMKSWLIQHWSMRLRAKEINDMIPSKLPR